MGLETGDKIADLNENWPLGSDPKSEGDNHLRLIKRVVLNDVLSTRDGGNVFAPITFDDDVTHLSAVRIERDNSNVFLNMKRDTNGPIRANFEDTLGTIVSRVEAETALNQLSLQQMDTAGLNPTTVRLDPAGDILAYGDRMDTSLPVASSVVNRERGDARYVRPDTQTTFSATQTFAGDVVITAGGTDVLSWDRGASIWGIGMPSSGDYLVVEQNGSTGMRVYPAGVAVSNQFAAITLEKGDGRYAQTAAFAALLSQLVANASITLGQSNTIASMMGPVNP